MARNKKPSLIALDGPVAAGKSTVGKLLARRLGYRFIDTGTMYRALTWLALKRGVGFEDEASLERLASQAEMEFVLSPDGDSRLKVNGEAVGPELRQPEVEAGVSLVARVPGVRRVLVAHQKQLSQGGRVVMAGRDIGTVVLPNAGLKVFLVASAEERARRRYLELQELGLAVDYDTILSELKRRDDLDSRRPVSPLLPAPDAQIVDTDSHTIDEVVTLIYRMADS